MYRYNINISYKSYSYMVIGIFLWFARAYL